MAGMKKGRASNPVTSPTVLTVSITRKAVGFAKVLTTLVTSEPDDDPDDDGDDCTTACTGRTTTGGTITVRLVGVNRGLGVVVVVDSISSLRSAVELTSSVVMEELKESWTPKTALTIEFTNSLGILTVPYSVL